MSVNQFADAIQHGMEHAAAIERGEPTYVFRKGEGWVPSFGPAEPVEISVKDTEVKVGDVILRVIYEDGYDMPYHSGPVVTATINGFVSIGANAHWHRVGSIGYINRVESVVVRRS